MIPLVNRSTLASRAIGSAVAQSKPALAITTA
jgi:hypothetical protein